MPLGSKKAKALREDEDSRRLMAELQLETDRGAALLAVSFLDEVLEYLLKAFLVNEPKLVNSLFQLNQPLGTFKAKLDFAYAMGLLLHVEYDNAQIINEIPADLSPYLINRSFNDEPVFSACSKLRVYNLFAISGNRIETLEQAWQIAYPGRNLTSRDRFLDATITLWLNWRRRSIEVATEGERRTVRSEAGIS